MVAEEHHNVPKDCLIIANIAPFGKPPAQHGWLAISPCEDANSYLAGMLVVRTIERNGPQRIAAKAGLGLLLQPFACLPSDLHACPFHYGSTRTRCCDLPITSTCKIFIRFRLALWRPTKSARKAS